MSPRRWIEHSDCSTEGRSLPIDDVVEGASIFHFTLQIKAEDLPCIRPRAELHLTSWGTRVLCMKTIFQMPACFCRKADSNHFWLVVPEASVILPLLT